MRRRQLKWLWARLKQLAGMKLSREELLMRLGAARKQARTAWRLIATRWLRTAPRSAFASIAPSCAGPGGAEGRYLLRTNLTDDDPARLWGLYLQLVSVEEAFKNLKGSVSRRISSSPSSPTACTSRSPAASTPWHQASRRAASSKSSPPCR